MADIQWPPTLPAYLERPGYRETLPDIVIRTPMETGPDKLRLDATTGIRGIQGSVIVTSAQLAIFKVFYHEVTRGGALAFDFLNQRTGETIEVYFQAEPQIGAVGGDYWMINFKLDRMDPTPEAAPMSLLMMKGSTFGDIGDLMLQGIG